MKTNTNKKIIATVLMLVVLVLVTIGVTYAFFTYMKQGSTENTISTGSLTFIYDEKEAGGNGINMTNVFPVSDDNGKALTGTNNVFDFQVLATTKGAVINYEVIAERVDSSTLPENMTKVYLTTLNGSTETPVETTVKNNIVTTYNELTDTSISGQTGKTLFQEIIPSGKSNYNKQFRLRMWLSESASNQTDGEWDYNNKSFSIRINVIANGEKAGLPDQKPNAPELVTGMIPVVYDETAKTWKKADITKEWYDYSSQQWANAVTVTSTNRSAIMAAPVGTPISMNDINTMWVWIPRYEYQYTNLSTQYAGGTWKLPGEIKVKFIKGTAAVSSDETTYKVHPTFTFDGKELSGLWYAKFETSTKEVCTVTNNSINTACDLTTLTPQIKPSVTPWRGARVSTMFAVSRKMQTEKYATFGFANNTNYDTHLSKNSEWGAVAYLTQSKYGKYGNPNYAGENKDVVVNNCTTYITGVGGDQVRAPGSTTTCTTNTYETTAGQGASTTGNITGVYDMSGGAYDAVMGALADPSGKPRSGYTTVYNSGYNGYLQNGSSYTSGVPLPSAKYYNLYASVGDSSLTPSATACSNGVCYGDALSETDGWYSNYGSFVNDRGPWMVRGGRAGNPIAAGYFTVVNSSGSANDEVGSRFVVTP